MSTVLQDAELWGNFVTLALPASGLAPALPLRLLKRPWLQSNDDPWTGSG